MADQSDVSAALVTLAAATLYPSGTASPSVAGCGIRVYAGWPNPQALDADLRAASPVCHVSVYPRPDERNTTRYMPRWVPVSNPVPTVTATVAGQTVTLGGTPGAGQVVGIIANGKAYPYAMTGADTLTTAAAALAALVVVDIPGTVAAGAVVTLPNSARLTAARVGTTGTAVREMRRQEKGWQIAVWADTPAHRDTIAAALDIVMAATTFLTMPDGTAARLVFRSSLQSDALQTDRLYRRDLFYTVEFATVQTETETQITQAQLNVSASIAGVDPAVTVATVYQ